MPPKELESIVNALKSEFEILWPLIPEGDSLAVSPKEKKKKPIDISLMGSLQPTLNQIL